MDKTKKLVANVCRTLFGLTFVFSGFVKTIDPWGTALKITEYLNVYGIEAFEGLRFVLAIGFCAAELMMGLMLTFGIKTRLVSIAAVVIMTFFLVVTFLSATVLLVEDCGCFGDALKMSPWASFGKNVVLWCLALVVWLDARKRLSFWPVTGREIIATVLFACASIGLGVYCYRHLPLVDFLPYKKGVNLYDAKYGATEAEYGARMIYRDLQSGELREFAVSDTTWYDTTRWEFVEMVEQAKEPATGLSLREFTVLDSRSEDVTQEIVGSTGRVYMLCVAKLDLITPRHAARFEKVVRRAYEQGARVVLLTATPISEDETLTFGDAPPVDVYNVDGTAMITMLRASVGMVVLEDGVIVGKFNWRDVK